MVDNKHSRKTDDSAAYLRSKKPLRAGRAVELPDLPYRRILIVTMGLLALLSSAYGLSRYVSVSERFKVDFGASNPRVSGLKLLDAERVRDMFADDAGTGLGDFDIESRRLQLLDIPWVRDVTVGRIWPNTIAVYVTERSPVAFLRLSGAGSARLIDGEGVILTPMEGKRFSLPVLTGIDPSMVIGSRRVRLDLFQRLMEALDGRRPRFSEMISEVDVADAENVVVRVAYKGDIIELQMGDQHLRHRFEIFLKYIDTWKAEFGPVASADLRFEDQVAVRPVRRR